MAGRAQAQKVAGKGYETYRNTSIIFMNQHNIHVIRDRHVGPRAWVRRGARTSWRSYKKLESVVSAAKANDAQWLAAVEDSGWLMHVRALLLGGCMMAEYVHNRRQSVLVHCSDGWDRTSQGACLAEVLLDPFYRTLRVRAAPSPHRDAACRGSAREPWARRASSS